MHNGTWHSDYEDLTFWWYTVRSYRARLWTLAESIAEDISQRDGDMPLGLQVQLEEVEATVRFALQRVQNAEKEIQEARHISRTTPAQESMG